MSILLSRSEAHSLIWNALTGSGTSPENTDYFTQAILGEKLQSALKMKFAEHPHIGDIRGRGLFCGVELVKDRETKVPFDPSNGLARKIKKATFTAGLICYP